MKYSQLKIYCRFSIDIKYNKDPIELSRTFDGNKKAFIKRPGLILRISFLIRVGKLEVEVNQRDTRLND